MPKPRPILDIYGSTGHGHDEHRHSQPVPWDLGDREMAPLTVVTASIPVRLHQLNRLLKSIERQGLQPERIIVQVDNIHHGAAETRNRALQKVPETSEAVTFMDDDDYMGKDHLLGMWTSLNAYGADYVYPWFTIAGQAPDPFPQFFGRPWSNDDPHQTTITTMVRRELAQKVGFREVPEGRVTPEGHRYGEDFQFTLECMAAGARIYHYPFRTWYWVVTGHNTSGRPDQWT